MEVWRWKMANRSVWKHLSRKKERLNCRQTAWRLLSLRGEKYQEYRAIWTRKRHSSCHRQEGSRVTKARDSRVRRARSSMFKGTHFS